MEQEKTNNEKNNNEIKPVKVLLIEDDFYICQLYRDIFSTNPIYKLTVINDIKNVSDIEEKIKEIKPDIVLLDLILLLTGEGKGGYILDKELGFEILNNLKSNKETDDIPVVIVSNLNNREDIERAKAIGADEYIIKSEIFPQQVFSVIERILGER